ncbi:hypothetical protein HAX54_034116, partial [Datura stramonium]|nr:hypothetical protein [Datura stramonium]
GGELDLDLDLRNEKCARNFELLANMDCCISRSTAGFGRHSGSAVVDNGRGVHPIHNRWYDIDEEIKSE